MEPEPRRLVAGIAAPLVKQSLDVSQRCRRRIAITTAQQMIPGPDLKSLNGSRFFTRRRYPGPLPCRKQGCPDRARRFP